MIREVHLRRSEWNDIPWKFEAGTPDISAQIGLGVAADYLLELGMDRLRDHEQRAGRLRAGRCSRARCPGSRSTARPPELRGGVVPFNLPGIHPHDVAQVLDRFGVAIRAGHHCTMPLHERLDLGATARASFQVYTIEGGHRRARRRAARGPAPVRRLGPRRYTPSDAHGRPLPRLHPRALPAAPQLRGPGVAVRLLRGVQPAVRRPDHHAADRRGRRGDRGRVHRPRLRDQPGVGVAAHGRDQGQAGGRGRGLRGRPTCSTCWASRSARPASSARCCRSTRSSTSWTRRASSR